MIEVQYIDYFLFLDFDIPEFLELKLPWTTTLARLEAGLRSTCNKGIKIRIS